MLRLFLPPNLPAACERDAISVKIELDLTAAPSAELLPGLAILQRLCGNGPPPPFIQIKRDQLRELVTALQGRRVFYRLDAPAAPILWIGPLLRGVSEHLGSAPKTEPAATKSPSTSTRSVSTPAHPHKRVSAPPSPLQVDGSEHFLSLALPSREHSAYSEILDLVKSNGFILEPSNRRWWLRDRHKVLNFLASHLDILRERFHADFTENFDRNTSRIALAEIECSIRESGDGYDLDLGLKAGTVNSENLRSAVSGGRGYVEDGSRIYLIPPDRLEKLAGAQQAVGGGRGASAARRTHHVGAARVPDLHDVLAELSPNYEAPESWKRRGESLRNLSVLPPAPLPDSLSGLLRPYQQLGAAWLWYLYQNRLGGILADEMGLGKTLQALALLTAVNARDTRNRLPSLVVCPASLVENWRREAARFAPHLGVFVHHGANRLPEGEIAGIDIIITSYGTLVRDRERLSLLDFSCLIADEAQHAKNRRTQNAKALREVAARGRFMLTGTPLENAIDDLRSLFEVILPGYIDAVPPGTKSGDRTWMDERLQAQTAPYILRRTKAAVAPELPAKIEQVIYCEPTSSQSALYRDWQQRSERELLDMQADGASEGALRLATLTQLLRLRQICCDPRLVAPTAEAGDSAKLDAFRELLSEAVDDGHRLLVFSQFTSLLGLLKDEIETQALSYCYLDGSMGPRQRQAEVDRYNQNDDIPVFLISLKAGGTGLNLTAADTVVHFDPWWNPAVEAQATDRAHRIGQTKVVTSYKLICAGTVEETVLQLQDTKRALLANVFEASDAASAKLSLQDLQALLHGRENSH